MVGDGYFLYTVAPIWCTANSQRYSSREIDLSDYKSGGREAIILPSSEVWRCSWGRRGMFSPRSLLSVMTLGAVKCSFTPRNHNLSDSTDMISAWRATERPPGGMGAGETGLLCVSSTILVAQHGAGAKKCWGPAPLIISNILRVNNLSFSDGAGNHENSAPAPLGD